MNSSVVQFEGGVDERAAWARVAAAFRKACSLYHDGRESEAMNMAAAELSPLVEAWSAACPLSGAAKKQKLVALFMDEGRRSGETELIEKMLSARIGTRAAVARDARAFLVNAGSLKGAIVLREAREPLAV